LFFPRTEKERLAHCNVENDFLDEKLIPLEIASNHIYPSNVAAKSQAFSTLNRVCLLSLMLCLWTKDLDLQTRKSSQIEHLVLHTCKIRFSIIVGSMNQLPTQILATLRRKQTARNTPNLGLPPLPDLGDADEQADGEEHLKEVES
jgi:hypothetical protein